MKKMMVMLLLALLGLLAGCQDQAQDQQATAPMVQIAHSAYYYEQGYVQAEGWRYDITLASSDQIKQLDKLANALGEQVLPDEFRLGQGYLITWRNAEGSVQREMLVLSEDKVSMQGMLFEAEGAQALFQWLEFLRLDEQSVGN